MTVTQCTCLGCGVVFNQKKGGRRVGKYCSRECAFKDPKWKTRLCKPRVDSPFPRCVICGVICAKRKMRMCSKACRMAAARMYMRVWYASRKPPTQKACSECGRMWVRAYGNKRRLFCSGACLKKHARRIVRARRRAKENGANSEPVNPLKVFARDGWCCQLCGVRTSRSLRGQTAPNAPELDHIVPMAVGGEHTYANTQCACRQCNSKKGAKALGQQRLIA